jgi:oxidoreductase
LKALVFGPTGRVGFEVVKELIKSPKWSHVTIVTRRIYDEWKTIETNQDKKLRIMLKESLDDLEDLSKWKDLTENYSTLFCCLGSVGKTDDKIKYLADYLYPLNAGRLAEYLKIPHYSLVSGMGADKNSWFYVMRMKAKLEEELGAFNFKLSISRPGGIYNGDKNTGIYNWIPKLLFFLPRIDGTHLARALLNEAELRVEKPISKRVVLYDNNALNYLAEHNDYPP